MLLAHAEEQRPDLRGVFASWLKRNGASFPSLEFRSSSMKAGSPSRGTGVYTTTAMILQEDESLASVPSHLLINKTLVERIAKDGRSDHAKRMARCLNGIAQEGRLKAQGPQLERLYLLVFLLWGWTGANYQDLAREAVEETEQTLDAEFWAPYIRILPTLSDMDTAVLWPKDSPAMDRLAGTDVDNAVFAKRAKLAREFQLLEPYLRHLDPPGQNTISAQRFCWVDAVFWSRVLSLGSALREYGSAEAVAEQNDYHLIPLVDFCNHDKNANIRWHVTDDPSAVVELRATTDGEPIEAGTELLISYGAKPNAELLFIHGFVIPDNANEFIMLPAPFIEKGFLNEDDDDDANEEKLAAHTAVQTKKALLAALGLRDMIAIRAPLEPLREDSGDDDRIADEGTVPPRVRLAVEKDLAVSPATPDPTFEMVSRDDLLTMYISVMTAAEGFRRSSDVSNSFLVGDQRLPEPVSKDSFLSAVRALPNYEVVRLRVWAILLQVVNGQLCALFEDEEREIEIKDDKEAERLEKVEVLRESHMNVLVAACKLLQTLQERWTEVEEVQEYLAAMQGADAGNEGDEGEGEEA
ncbi:hypothetical protein HKX48_002752 [Thoreauomyces humboldtii]|nr:hypothetical protein HKX48_002752 [Thoreauomyces humboldtii]